MFEKMEQGHLQTLSISKNKITWLKTGKELMVEGKMFDVFSWKESTGDIIVTGLFDEEEDNLLQQFKQLTEKGSATSKNLAPLLTLLFTPFAVEDTEPLQGVVYLMMHKRYSRYNDKAVLAEYRLATPPPRV